MRRVSLSHKPVKFSLTLLLMLLVVLPLFVHPAAAQSSDEVYNKTFAWDYNGRHWTWNLSIPKALYEAYKQVPVYMRTENGPEGYGFCTTTNDAYIQNVASQLNKTTSELGYGSFDTVSFVLAFVQSLTYASDNVTEGYNEYPRFPIETLVDDGGDCEDTAILFAALTLSMGYGTVFINPPNHYAVGILGNNLPGTYFTKDNKTYYYCETTGNGFKIGDLPQEFSGQKAYIYYINENDQYVPDIAVTIPSVQPTEQPANVPYLSTPAPTLAPGVTPSPTMTQPTVQPVLPLSLNLISDEPVLFAIIIAAIVLAIFLAVWSARRSRNAQPPAESSTSEAPVEIKEETSVTQESKFCIFCGSHNKDYAVFCEQCGKQIGDS